MKMFLSLVILPIGLKTVSKGVSVAVSCFTLVVISVERYYAICRPLKSRSWQTKSHAYKAITGIWCVSLVIMIPIAVFTKLIEIKNGRYACRENWKDEHWDKVYAVFQDIVLLLMPLIIMAVAYALVSRELWMSYSSLMSPEKEDEGGDPPTDSKSDERLLKSPLGSDKNINKTTKCNGVNIGKTHALCNSSRVTNQRSNANKRRVIKMLFVVVLEYFVCWTPLYVISTWMIIDYDNAKAFVSPLAKSLFHLLAYVSSCIHPMTYCFMNNRFRQGFLSAFRCCRGKGNRRSTTVECTDVSESHSRMRGVMVDGRR